MPGSGHTSRVALSARRPRRNGKGIAMKRAGDRKRTAWKRSRTHGDIHGRRRWPRFSEGIAVHCHSLAAPEDIGDLPVPTKDNPSRDFFHPVSAEEVRLAPAVLPKWEMAGIPHIWRRRAARFDYEREATPPAQFAGGGGFRTWRRDLKRLFHKSVGWALIGEMHRQGCAMSPQKGGWTVRPTVAQVRRFYFENNLVHEMGHHIDWCVRHWSKANHTVTETAADHCAAAFRDRVQAARDRIAEAGRGRRG